MAPNKSYCSVSENRNSINQSVTELNSPNRNQRVNSWQTSKDEIPFIAKERMSPYLWMRESCPIHTVSSHAVIKRPSSSPHLSESLLISPATLACPLSFLHDQLQSTQTFDNLVQLEGII